MQTKRGYCKECGRNVLLQKEQCNHILHLLLSLLTYGVWVLVWINVACRCKWRCPHCGAVCQPESAMDNAIKKLDEFNARMKKKAEENKAKRKAKGDWF